ncbi:hypothetical protein KAFR_0C03810 [Kazachstania africana CBS 2517]|uniref:Uncharacterized protein n=1 Tax=Kazachstania africana (strain ATCC 22294 / BCRC 22015 / CBS 2517 / CECT 1963 / NBRC 1671 / NRRL Y-8276) TaxID=1071382 RepID=H2ASM2_KAZAF|nr:hypothetical protein KAFR_0C03810 [Kazachstania africana CBS 2517]CCF57372.1 hypothetical protein KAFR_0C03810 [Kazachstania africana CBS 2517]
MDDKELLDFLLEDDSITRQSSVDSVADSYFSKDMNVSKISKTVQGLSKESVHGTILLPKVDDLGDIVDGLDDLILSNQSAVLASNGMESSFAKVSSKKQKTKKQSKKGDKNEGIENENTVPVDNTPSRGKPAASTKKGNKKTEYLSEKRMKGINKNSNDKDVGIIDISSNKTVVSIATALEAQSSDDGLSIAQQKAALERVLDMVNKKLRELERKNDAKSDKYTRNSRKEAKTNTQKEKDSIKNKKSKAERITDSKSKSPKRAEPDNVIIHRYVENKRSHTKQQEKDSERHSEKLDSISLKDSQKRKRNRRKKDASTVTEV